MISYISNGKAMIIRLMVQLTKKKRSITTIKKMSEHFPKLNEPFSGDVSVKLDLFNYVAKDDFEGAAGID